VDFTTFGIFALWAAGESARSTRVKKAARWLTDQQETDGGFATNQFAPSDLDDTGAALQALAAAGYAASHPNVGRALHYLADAQTPSGGFPLMGGGPANAESTAYALQGLVATAAVAATAHGERDPIFARCRLRMAAFASRRVAAPTRCG
jgi:prenyltransferase beta subunit